MLMYLKDNFLNIKVPIFKVRLVNLKLLEYIDKLQLLTQCWAATVGLMLNDHLIFFERQ